MSARLKASLEASWYRPEPPWPLRALSGLFGAVVSARATAYARGWFQRTRVAAPVIVVGNLSVGGNGKTPMVLWLCEQLRAEGRRPGIVLRGYGGSASRQSAPTLVQPDSDPALVGDEALLLRRRAAVPVVVCRRRALAAQRLLQEAVDVVIADDGLQHLALARDAEIVVIDAHRGLGNGHLLPAGPLREPASRLQAVDVIVVNGGSAEPALPDGRRGPITVQMDLVPDALVPLAAGELPRELADFRGRTVHAVAGIGHPERFFSQLRAAGLTPIAHAFEDHHRYRREELQFADDAPILMTEKDAVKCQGLGLSNAWFVPVTARLSTADAEVLLRRLAPRIARRDESTEK